MWCPPAVASHSPLFEVLLYKGQKLGGFSLHPYLHISPVVYAGRWLLVAGHRSFPEGSWLLPFHCHGYLSCPWCRNSHKVLPLSAVLSNTIALLHGWSCNYNRLARWLSIHLHYCASLVRNAKYQLGCRNYRLLLWLPVQSRKELWCHACLARLHSA